LMTVDALSEVAVQEGVFDVKLVHRPPSGCREVEHGSDRRWFDNR
jgi:hypothetical protein